MVTCPVCGRRIQRREIVPPEFRCRGCHEKLRIKFPRPWLVWLASLLLAFLVPYLAGARGNDLLWDGIILFWPFYLGYAGLRGFLFPRLARDSRERADEFPHVVGPPDRSGKG